MANQAIIYLFNEEEWILSVLSDVSASKLRTSAELHFIESAFLNEINYLSQAAFHEFEGMRFRDGLHRAWFDMIIARDMYRDWCLRCGVSFHEKVILTFISTLLIINSPIIPHWTDSLYCKLPSFSSVEKKEVSVVTAKWPSFPSPYDKLMRKQFLFFRDFLKNARQAAIKAKVTGKKGLIVYLAKSFEEKKLVLLQYMVTLCQEDGSFLEDFLKRLKDFVEGTVFPLFMNFPLFFC